jgi:16S rRNA (cytosine1402-N4)-methyltransferase
LELFTEEMTKVYHYPVMHKEVLKYLDVKNKKVVVDCTLGVGSHASKIFEAMGKQGFFVGIDKDIDSLKAARQKLKLSGNNFHLEKMDFININKVLDNLNIEGVDAFLFDLGISTYQLSNPERGFSFLKEGPLDMRMDRDYFLSAYDLINNLSENELGSIFRKFGEERYSRRIAHYLVQERKDEPISTTTQLADIVKDAVPLKNRYQRIHPATRIFQSLRIAVNRELEALETGLNKAISFLNKGGRIGVISFHSLEDRIVKHTFKSYASSGSLKIITKKPIIPGDNEKEENPASRSAKLRVAEKN